MRGETVIALLFALGFVVISIISIGKPRLWLPAIRSYMKVLSGLDVEPDKSYEWKTRVWSAVYLIILSVVIIAISRS